MATDHSPAPAASAGPSSSPAQPASSPAPASAAAPAGNATAAADGSVANGLTYCVGHCCRFCSMYDTGLLPSAAPIVFFYVYVRTYDKGL